MFNNIKENIVINNQEDEDGYVLYPSCAIIKKELTADLSSVPPIAGKYEEPLKVKKLIGSFSLSPLVYPKG